MTNNITPQTQLVKILNQLNDLGISIQDITPQKSYDAIARFYVRITWDQIEAIYPHYQSYEDRAFYVRVIELPGVTIQAFELKSKPYTYPNG